MIIDRFIDYYGTIMLYKFMHSFIDYYGTIMLYKFMHKIDNQLKIGTHSNRRNKLNEILIYKI